MVGGGGGGSVFSFNQVKGSVYPFFRGTGYFGISSRIFEQTKTVPFTSALMLMKRPFNPRATCHQNKRFPIFTFHIVLFATRHVWEGLHAHAWLQAD